MNVIRISDGPLRGVVLETRRRGIAARIGGRLRAIAPRRTARVASPPASVDLTAVAPPRPLDRASSRAA